MMEDTFTPYDLVVLALSSATVMAALAIAERMFGNILSW
jgi:uncharacterized OsmC-like protein